MIVNIERSFTWEASHWLEGMPKGHKCGYRWVKTIAQDGLDTVIKVGHGHSYQVILTLKGEVDSKGFVRDCGDMKSFKQFISEQFDYKHLNLEVFPSLGFEGL